MHAFNCGHAPSLPTLTLSLGLAHTRSPGLVVLELFAGAGTHSAIVCAVLKNNLPSANYYRVTVDCDEALNPDIVGDIGAWTSEHSAALRGRYPLCNFILHGSPPCTQYSVANTTSKRPEKERLAEADENVKQMLSVYRDLGDSALLMTVENPGTGKLVGRPVSSLGTHARTHARTPSRTHTLTHATARAPISRSSRTPRTPPASC
jgi:hypothetical protein